MADRPPRLLDQVRRELRVRHYSPRTESAYIHWIVRYIRFHGVRHPNEMGVPEVSAFLSHLAVEANVAPSTQNQALNALVFRYGPVLGRPLGELAGVVRARKARKLPVVLSREEVERLLIRLEGSPRLVASLLYGSGLRLLEALQLRVKDLDFARGELTIREAKGGRDRVSVLPEALHEPLKAQIRRVREQSMRWTCPPTGAGLRCRVAWRGSTRTRPSSSDGSSCSLRPAPPATGARAASAAGIWRRARCRGG